MISGMNIPFAPNVADATLFCYQRKKTKMGNTHSGSYPSAPVEAKPAPKGKPTGEDTAAE